MSLRLRAQVSFLSERAMVLRGGGCSTIKSKRQVGARYSESLLTGNLVTWGEAPATQLNSALGVAGVDRSNRRAAVCDRLGFR